MVLMQVKRRIISPEFLSLDKEEIELLLGLMKGEMITPMLEHLEFLFTLHGNIFNMPSEVENVPSWAHLSSVGHTGLSQGLNRNTVEDCALSFCRVSEREGHGESDWTGTA